MSYNDIEIDVIFDKLWAVYPSKEKPAAGKKALTVALRLGNDHKEIIKSVEIYALESEGSEFHYHFVNFLNEDHWKDILSYHKNAQAHLDTLKLRRQYAIEIIKSWNKACRPHWCECLDVELRAPIVVTALANKSFRDNWKKALAMAGKLFYHAQHSGDKFTHLSLSLRWFCTIAPAEKHTVLRIIEGEYGRPNREPNYGKREERRLTEEDKINIRKDYTDVFADSDWAVAEPVDKPKPEKKNEIPNPELGKIVDEFIDGLSPPEEKDKGVIVEPNLDDDPFGLV